MNFFKFKLPAASGPCPDSSFSILLCKGYVKDFFQILDAGRRSQVAGRKPMPHIPVKYISPCSQRAAKGSLHRGAGRQRRSERLKVGPYDGPGWGVSRPCEGERDHLRWRGGLLYEPRVTRSDVVSLSLSRRDAASESSSMNDERPTTNDIADGDGLRPAACKKKGLAACAASPFLSLKIPLSKYRGDCTIRIRRRSRRLRIRLSVLHRV